MKTIQCDKRGRIYIRESLRSRYGDRFVIIETLRGLMLMSVPSQPERDLENQGVAFKDVTLEHLRARIRVRTDLEVGLG